MLRSNRLSFFISLVFLLHYLPTFSQKTISPEELVAPQGKENKKCKDYVLEYQSLPAEVRYGIIIEEGIIYFYFPDNRYLEVVLDHKNDGVAVDVVPRSAYDCDQTIDPTKVAKGILLPPMYRNELRKQMMVSETGEVLIKCGELPEGLDASEVECNLLVLRKKYVCGYHAFTNIDYGLWGLLPMGLYRRMLTEEERFAEGYDAVSKQIQFEIPFRHNQSEFDKEDMNLVYDYLNFTDFNIKKVSIKAYTSVEGSEEHNLKLQRARAERIVEALQQYQKPEIISHVEAHENWVEFLRDIEGTPYAYMAKLSRAEIKELLKNEELLAQMETGLAHHRKAIISLTMQKRFANNEDDPEQMIQDFNKQVAAGDVVDALYLQEMIFDHFEQEGIPDDYREKLEVPYEITFASLLSNFAVADYDYEQSNLYDAIATYDRLLELAPNNQEVLYNSLVLKMKALAQNDVLITSEELKNSIKKLDPTQIDEVLIDRMWVNYYIIMTWRYQSEKKYGMKKKALSEVYWRYKKLDLNDEDLLSLSRYLSFYSQFDQATYLLEKRAASIDAEEDLLFYYLRLTLSDDKKIKQYAYRMLMLNAIDKNKQRFCDLFLPRAQGGYTFQLLDNAHLKETYCEYCEGH